MSLVMFASLALVSVFLLISASPEDFYKIQAQDLDGNWISFETLKQKVVMVTNVAFGCPSSTYQFAVLGKVHDGLDALYPDHFRLLVFPSSQFTSRKSSRQEWMELVDQLGVQLNLMKDVNVTGQLAHPVYQFLAAETKQEPGGNFWKYLIDHTGQVTHVFDDRYYWVDMANITRTIIWKLLHIQNDYYTPLEKNFPKTTDIQPLHSHSSVDL